MPLPPGLLKDLRGDRRVFLETGMHRGDGIQRALDAGFERIYSCDRSAFALGWCSHRFLEKRDMVNLHLQDSREFLREMKNIVGTDSAVIWLDAHYCGGNGEVVGWGGIDDAGHEEDHPILQEIRILRTYETRSNMVLVDDVRMMGQGGWPQLDDVRGELSGLNPDYQLWYADGLEHAHDILIADPSDVDA